MGLEMKPELGLRQQLSLTPQLKQAIKLLQLSRLELVEQVQEEMTENVMLEGDVYVDDEMSDGLQKLNERAQSLQKDAAEQGNLASGADPNDLGFWEKLLQEHFAFKGWNQSGGGGGRDDDLPSFEATHSTSPSLYQHLHDQLRLESCTDGEAVAAEIIINHLDPNGYLAMPLADVAAAAEVDMVDAEGGQLVVMGLDPIGCGANDLVHCLIDQAREHYPEDPFFETLIKKHLKGFEKRNYNEIARQMDMDVEDVIEYHRMLRDEFTPRPGSGYSDADPQFITADITVEKLNGEWKITLNEDGMPKLRISPLYKKLLDDTATKEERRYLKAKLESAEFLLNSIYRRQSTIYKVVHSIVDRQKEYFEKGEAFLRPMVLKDVAEEIEVHESTVSRVTSGKYMQCPQGVRELKYFFSSGVSSTSKTGEDVASAAVKHHIKELITKEDPNSPLSDEQLAHLLKARGVSCARRTVAKYREAMNILPSSRRRDVL